MYSTMVENTIKKLSDIPQKLNDAEALEFFVANIQPKLPDSTVRLILKGIIANTARHLASLDFPEKEYRLVKRIKDLKQVTFDTDAANEQHYEVPTDFFHKHLSVRLKYSASDWRGVKSLDEAEEQTIKKYQQKLGLAELPPGSRVLEIGNGWGSLCLANARRFPQLVFDAFSNSATQVSYIQKQATKEGLNNLNVWKQDVDEFVRDESTEAGKYERIVSIECIEHARAYHLLFAKMRHVLKDEGHCFVQILGHREYSYLMNQNSWMGRNFFTGGTIPSMNLFRHFNDDLVVTENEVLGGLNYSKTLDFWLEEMYKRKDEIMPILVDHCKGDEAEARKLFQGWRMFYLMCSVCFGHNKGKDWLVGWFILRPRR